MNFDVEWYWWDFRRWLRSRPDEIARWIAWKLPRPVATHAFIRVYGAWGELGPDFDVVLRAWESPRVPIAVDPQVKRPTGAGSTGKPDTRD